MPVPGYSSKYHKSAHSQCTLLAEACRATDIDARNQVITAAYPQAVLPSMSLQWAIQLLCWWKIKANREYLAVTYKSYHRSRESQRANGTRWKPLLHGTGHKQGEQQLTDRLQTSVSHCWQSKKIWSIGIRFQTHYCLYLSPGNAKEKTWWRWLRYRRWIKGAETLSEFEAQT